MAKKRLVIKKYNRGKQSEIFQIAGNGVAINVFSRGVVAMFVHRALGERFKTHFVILEKLSNCLVEEVTGVVRVFYNIVTKPPSIMEAI